MSTIHSTKYSGGSCFIYLLFKAYLNLSFILQMYTRVFSGDDTTERIISLLKQHGDIIDQNVSILTLVHLILRIKINMFNYSFDIVFSHLTVI